MEVLKALWEHGPSTVRDLHHQLNQRGFTWAYNTVLTLLQRLETKQIVRSDKSAHAHVFHTRVSREKLLHDRLTHLAQELYDAAAAPLVLALIENHRFTPEEIEQFRQMLDHLEEKQR
jgi:BlaI family transcriptional regulator, penicillinase repressor